MTPVLSTNLRFTQTQDPTGVARPAARTRTVTAPAYQVCAPRPSVVLSAAVRPNTATTSGWSSIGLEAMPKVDFHDRWPLHSPS